MTLAGSVVALGSSRTSDDYIRTNFTVEDGLPDNIVNAIVKLGTVSSGLARSQALPASTVGSLSRSTFTSGRASTRFRQLFGGGVER